MSNFSPRLEDATEKQLKYWINETDANLASLASEELTRRRFEQFDKTTTIFSKILGFFALVQIMVAVMQFVLNVYTAYQNLGQKILVLLIFAVLLLVTFYFSYKIIDKR
ncbi:MAG: hypothetical protein WC631_01200 [Candidatus Paceibacterota bacterium]|jgi:hypothetical protein